MLQEVWLVLTVAAATAVAVVPSPPTMIKQPKQEQLYQVSQSQDEPDKPFALECEAQGNPEPTYQWTKNNKEFDHVSYDNRISQQPHRGTLLFNKPDDVDEGLYQCRATNVHGTSVSNAVFLRKSGKTRITLPPESHEVAAGKSSTFRCGAEADPSLELKITWLFNGEPIDPELDARMQVSDNSLTITRTMELDSGTYTCLAQTELDDDRASATLIVLDVPNAPQIVHVECEPVTALVEWRPTGDRRAPILSYSIQYNTSFTPDIWEDAFVNIPAPETKFKVSLSPWANYTFRVVARNKIGSSPPSTPFGYCKTLEDVPHKNPDRVSGRGDRSDNLVISWEPMSPIEHNAPGFFYKVLWKRDDLPDASWNSRIIEDWRQHSHVVYDQPPCKPYRIKVEAYNRRGQAHTAAYEVLGHSGEDEEGCQ
ncbi:neuroglian-like [Ornithodoros turicata]|uniref:neuroglian-like n=1 Tax=Ornithodoros turicata TaxID=34597 RepID=UPI0031391849